jgi:hypothetical protein
MGGGGRDVSIVGRIADEQNVGTAVKGEAE